MCALDTPPHCHTLTFEVCRAGLSVSPSSAAAACRRPGGWQVAARIVPQRLVNPRLAVRTVPRVVIVLVVAAIAVASHDGHEGATRSRGSGDRSRLARREPQLRHATASAVFAPLAANCATVVRSVTDPFLLKDAACEVHLNVLRVRIVNVLYGDGGRILGVAARQVLIRRLHLRQEGGEPVEDRRPFGRPDGAAAR